MKFYTLFASCLVLVLSCSCSERADFKTDPHRPQINPIVRNDISNQRVTAFAEDSFGHVWIGTYRGLNKSTGREFYQYFTTEDSLGLPDNQITRIYRDSRDRMWIGTVNGICRYTDQDNFRNINVGSLSTNIIQIFENHTGSLFVNTANSVCLYNPAADFFEEKLSIARSPFLQNSCFISPDNDLWVVTPVDMRRYSSTTFELKDSLGLTGFPTYSYMTDDGVLWLSGDSETVIYDTAESCFKPLPSSLSSHPRFRNARIVGLYPYGHNSLIVNTDRNGLFLYDRDNDVTRHQYDAGFPFERPSFRINTIYTDRNQNTWFGSYDQGVAVRYSYKKNFNNDSFLSTVTNKSSVMSVDCDAKGNLWIVTLQDGLIRYNTLTNELNRFRSKEVFSYEGAEDVDMTSVFIDSSDNVWIMTALGVVKFRWDGKRLIEEQAHFVFMPMSMTEGTDGTIWITTASEYLYYLAPQSDRLEVLKPLSSNYTFMPVALTLPDGNILLAAFRQKIKEIDNETKTIFDAEMNEQDWNACIRRSHFIPTCMYADRDGMVWIGTMANGLLCYDRRTGNVREVPGTPCADICSIEEDAYGNLWVSTLHGLGKYNRTTGQFINWFEVDGIGGNQFYDRSSCVLRNGMMVFGGTHGLTYFDPDDVTVNEELPLIFERLAVNSIPVQPEDGGCIDRALAYRPEIRLEHYQNHFSISFAALDYSEFERVHYQYKLEGYDDFWIESLNNSREAYYANVPAGRYEFKVRVTNNEHTVTLAEGSLQVTIDRHPLLSWWALLVYVMLLFLLFLSLLRVRNRLASEKQAKLKAQQEKEQEKKVNEMNMTFFANISHEFRTPLTMISGPVEQLAADRKLSDRNRRMLSMVQRNTRRMLRLVNQLLDFNRLEDGQLKLQVKQIDVISQLSNLADIFKVTADDKGVFFKTWGFEESLFIWVDEDCLDKICFNLLSNAMKFTSAGGKVEFGIDVISREEAGNHFVLSEKDRDSRYLKIVIKDSGPGIPADQRDKIFERYYQIGNKAQGSYNWGTGIGLYFAKTLAELHHGYLKAGDRDEGAGAQFTLLLPVSESSYSDEEKTSLGGQTLHSYARACRTRKSRMR